MVVMFAALRIDHLLGNRVTDQDHVGLVLELTLDMGLGHDANRYAQLFEKTYTAIVLVCFSLKR
jgi:hypothetical protein